jgi:hypothetical protein
MPSKYPPEPRTTTPRSPKSQQKPQRALPSFKVPRATQPWYLYASSSTRTRRRSSNAKKSKGFRSSLPLPTTLLLYPTRRGTSLRRSMRSKPSLRRLLLAWQNCRAMQLLFLTTLHLTTRLSMLRLKLVGFLPLTDFDLNE